jgi:hypothetical protein
MNFYSLKIGLVGLAVSLTLATQASAALVFPPDLPNNDPSIDWTGEDVTNKQPVVRALALARIVWNNVEPNCPLGVSVRTFNDPDPATVARADYAGCNIWLDRDYLARIVTEDWLGCYVLTHEYGHLLGYRHDYAGHEDVMQGGVPKMCLPDTTPLDPRYCPKGRRAKRKVVARIGLAPAARACVHQAVVR